ncbi:MAG: DNA-methyltransferase, partial [Betaproteobacteria bacterium]
MSWRVIQGDARERIWELEPNSVDMVMTSPPYYGLRDYGCAEQIGLEASPEEYIEQLLLVFDGVARALKPTGTCWVNIGDTYYGGGQGHKPSNKSIYASRDRIPDRPGRNGTRRRDGWKRRKQLLNIPARFSIAMQERGWILRSRVIWHKPNAMTESAQDRPSRDYEDVFLFSKRERYYWDREAVRQ